MALKSLDGLLHRLEAQPTWQTHRQLRAILDCWHQVVGEIVAQQTQPVAIRQMVLQVAVANHLWAQNLMFERVRILDKLNAYLSTPLSDIRFSTARWHKQIHQPSLTELATVWHNHPSFLDSADMLTARSLPHPKAPETDPEIVFQGWIQQVQRRSQSLPLCPKCHCPSPIGELQRWSVCALCAVKKH
jgi:predicted nucleic acid-binding Zn ribbon protein